MSHRPTLWVSGERWTDVVGYEGVYQVSDRGRVRRIGIGARTRKQPHVLSETKHKRYAGVHLCVNGIGKVLSVHRLVAAAFLGPCAPGREVNHIDGNRRNNAAANLEYVTRRENMTHAFRLGLIRGCVSSTGKAAAR